MRSCLLLINKKSVSIHQSQYLPWMPYFKKIHLSDVFVILDDVQFQKNGVQNRNMIRNKEGEFWITLPVNNRLEEKINEKRIANPQILRKHWKMIEQSYSKTANWKYYKEELFYIYSSEHRKLIDINEALLHFFLEKFQIKTQIKYSSEMDINGSKGDLVLKICKEVNADIYLSGLGSKNYLIGKDFSENNINIQYLDSVSPNYQQINNTFIPNLSALDFLMNAQNYEIENYFNN